ncbi:MAG: class I SAM-dependent methyltransferase [bacterium]|nr:class I SAM-dependent methyltransferase [bacterium]
MFDLSSGSPSDLLDRISQAAQSRSVVRPLSGEQYMRSHVAFESASDQQSKILRWLTDDLLASESKEFSVASIGAGSGILDVPLLRAVCQNKRVEYSAVEPFEEQCRAFEQRAAESLDPDNPRLTIINSMLGRMPHGLQFDYVLSIHSVYYFEDLRRALEQMLALRKPGGQLTIAVAPCEAMNRLSEIFWRPQQEGNVWFQADVERELGALGMKWESARIEGALTFDKASNDATDIVSFIVQCPIDQLPEEDRDMIFSYIQMVGEECDGRLSVPHPVSILTLA